MTCVYIIECAGYCKIGVAADPHGRAKDINTGSPIKATVYRVRAYESRDLAFQVERRLHRYFAKFRTNGEWFDVPKEKVWHALTRLDTPKARPAGAKKSHHLGPDTDNLAMEELREALNAVHAERG